MKKIFLIFLLFLSQMFAQETGFELMPMGLHFLPLKANMQESRLGILYFPDNANLKVDIGNNVDIIGLSFNDAKISFGIEFMAYALSTNYQGRRLQIDALDGFFGGNGTVSFLLNNDKLFFRFRIIHNSAHFVDGHFDFTKNIWKKNIEPIPFTQDFGEITSAYVHEKTNYGLKAFTSVGYSSLVRPSLIQKWWSTLGYELNYKIHVSEKSNSEINVFLSSHIKLIGMPKYKLNYNNMIGVKFGSWDGKGVVFYLDYYIGNNYFSEYYYNRIKKFGIGFFVDFI